LIAGTFSYNAKVYRGHNPRWAYLPTSGEGAKRHGGRFNPKGVGALYTSVNLKTAWLEAQQGFAYKTQPLTIVTYQVQCEDLLDLTNPKILKQFKITRDILNCPWELMIDEGETPPTWELVNTLISKGVAGIRVPSFAFNAQQDDINIVFWDWSDQGPHQVLAIDDEDRLKLLT